VHADSGTEGGLGDGYAFRAGRADPLLELRLFRSLPFSSAVGMALFALCGFGAFLFVTTQYLPAIRDIPAWLLAPPTESRLDKRPATPACPARLRQEYRHISTKIKHAFGVSVAIMTETTNASN